VRPSDTVAATNNSWQPDCAYDHTDASDHDTEPASVLVQIQARGAKDGEVLRWCLDRLARLERGEKVVVNLRPDTEDATAYIRFDHGRVRRVLARIAAALDLAARHGAEWEATCPE